MSELSEACTANSESPGCQVSRASTRSAGGSEVSIPGTVARCADDTTARRAPIRRPDASSTADARPDDVSIRATGADATTDEPWSTSCRTSAAGSAPEPPTGVAQPNLIRPDVIADGSAPVPGRRGSWIVANPSQINRSRTTGCSNRACTTSHAERARRSSYCLDASSSSGASPELEPGVGGAEAAVPLAHHRPQLVGVRPREPRHLLDRRVEVAVHRDRVAAGQRQHHGRVGVEVGQAVRRQQAELVVADHRVRLDEHVRAGARVVQEPRQRQLLGDRVAADDVLRLDARTPRGRPARGRPRRSARCARRR